MIVDRQGRRFRNLRISLTAACNYACTYCVPDGKRLVAAGCWNGRPALVKLFLAEAHQRHGERERAGLVALHAAGVRTPALSATALVMKLGPLPI